MGINLYFRLLQPYFNATIVLFCLSISSSLMATNTMNVDSLRNKSSHVSSKSKGKLVATKKKTNSKTKSKTTKKTSNIHKSKAKTSPNRILVADTKLDSVSTLSFMTIREKILTEARSMIGIKYKSGGKTPNGFDCSGFVIHVLGRFDYQMSACSADQSKCGKSIKPQEAKPGDLIFFGNKNRVHHVGIITEIDAKKMMMIHSSSSRGVVEEDIMKSDYWLKRIRIIRDLESIPRQKGLTMN